MLTLILIDNQYVQNVVFSFEKSSNCQSHSSSGSYLPTTQLDPPPPYPRQGKTFWKLSRLQEGTRFLLEIFYLLYLLTYFGSSVLSVSHARFSSKPIKRCIISTFLIHSGSVQKMLTALFKLVWNTQKSTSTYLFEYQGKMFLNIENVLVKVSEKQHWMHCVIVFLHIFEICQFFIDL